MPPFDTHPGPSAPQNTQYVGPMDGTTSIGQRRRDASSGAALAEQSGQNQRRPVRSDYRCHVLLLEHDAVLAEMRQLTQQFCNGLIGFYEHRELDARCLAKERAIRQAIQEEMDAEPQTRKERIKDWGFTGDDVTRIDRDLFNQNLSGAYNLGKSTRYFPYRRRLAGKN